MSQPSLNLQSSSVPMYKLYQPLKPSPIFANQKSHLLSFPLSKASRQCPCGSVNSIYHISMTLDPEIGFRQSFPPTTSEEASQGAAHMQPSDSPRDPSPPPTYAQAIEPKHSYPPNLHPSVYTETASTSKSLLGLLRGTFLP